MFVFCVAGDSADAVCDTRWRWQSGELLGRTQAHGTVVASRVRAIPKSAAPAPEVADIVFGGVYRCAHSVHPDVVQ